ncbi:MAG: hypothetical protein KJP02_12230, partial [Octadecabacter sp.]|nr:hypothetical protein [Octadecabacter sp.]
VLMIPTLFAATLATWVFFDAFRNQAVNLKAAYTISDALSRETEMITNTYVINMWNLHRFLTDSPTLTRMRISVIQYQEENDKYVVVWSRAKGGGADFDNGNLSLLGISNDDMPPMPDREVLIYVQTAVDYMPGFSIGMEGFTFKNSVFTRPRFSPNQICYSPNGTYSGRICPTGT